MSQYGYNYNICMVRDSVTCLQSMENYNLEGWETVSVFKDDKGILSIAIRKPMTEWEYNQAQREKYKDDKTIINPRSRG